MWSALRQEMGSGTIPGYFLQAVPVALAAGIGYAVFRFLYVRRRRCLIQWPSEVMGLLFVCYLTGLCSLVILPANFWLHVYDGILLGWWEEMGTVFRLGEVNLVPVLVRYLQGEVTLGSWVKEMLAGNLAMFVPFGFFLPFLTKRLKRAQALLAAIVVPLLAESLQLIFGRSFDIDDLICNFLGIVIGLLIAWPIRKASRGWASSS